MATLRSSKGDTSVAFYLTLKAKLATDDLAYRKAIAMATATNDPARRSCRAAISMANCP